MTTNTLSAVFKEIYADELADLISGSTSLTRGMIGIEFNAFYLGCDL